MTEARVYREVAEAALATATPEELRQLVLVFADHADGLKEKVFDRNAAARTLLTWCKIQDRGRVSYFDFIKSVNKSIARVRELSPILNFDHREALLEVAASELAGLVAVGCPELQLPDESLFPVREESKN